ncbi:RHS repeat-associated core domain-containing protein [Pseudomonas vancouverensis]|nr:RHS repeat-associated core domain-containing protein [Pseudomonas vancouverensis]SDV15511.1 RHS repeat-associated core domain-containing protein [Pseudomonas vancouverensis]
MPPRKSPDQNSQTWRRTVLVATDRGQSVIGEIVDGKLNAIAYSAYGEQSAQQEVAGSLGFNGQLRESTIGWYLLGNGYRAYNPRLMRFHSPDSWSPFGGGGLNAYMYCVGDPVNRFDPTGHRPGVTPWIDRDVKRFFRGVFDFFFGGSQRTGSSHSKALGATTHFVDQTGVPMTPQKDGMIRAFKTIGATVSGAPGPRGTSSPAVGYGVTPAKNFPGYVGGAARDGLTNHSLDTPRQPGTFYAGHSSPGTKNAGKPKPKPKPKPQKKGSFYDPRIVHEGKIPDDWSVEHMTHLGGAPHSTPFQAPPQPQAPPPPSPSPSPPSSRDSTPPRSRRSSGDPPFWGRSSTLSWEVNPWTVRRK